MCGFVGRIKDELEKRNGYLKWKWSDKLVKNRLSPLRSQLERVKFLLASFFGYLC